MKPDVAVPTKSSSLLAERSSFGLTARSGSIRGIRMRGCLWVAGLFIVLACTENAEQQSILRWGGDAEGGAPYVEADPADPSRFVGFDVEVAELIAKGLGRKAQFVEIS